MDKPYINTPPATPTVKVAPLPPQRKGSSISVDMTSTPSKFPTSLFPGSSSNMAASKTLFGGGGSGGADTSNNPPPLTTDADISEYIEVPPNDMKIHVISRGSFRSHIPTPASHGGGHLVVSDDRRLAAFISPQFPKTIKFWAMNDLERCAQQIEAVLVNKSGMSNDRKEAMTSPEMELVVMFPEPMISLCFAGNSTLVANSETTVYFVDLSTPTEPTLLPARQWVAPSHIVAIDAISLDAVAVTTMKHGVMVLAPKPLPIPILSSCTTATWCKTQPSNNSMLAVCDEKNNVLLLHVTLQKVRGMVRCGSSGNLKVVSLLWPTPSILVVALHDGESTSKIRIFQIDPETFTATSCWSVNDPLYWSIGAHQHPLRFFMHYLPQWSCLIVSCSWSSSMTIMSSWVDPEGNFEWYRWYVTKNREEAATAEVLGKSMWRLSERPWVKSERQGHWEDQVFPLSTALATCTTTSVPPVLVLGDNKELEGKMPFPSSPTLFMVTTDGVIELVSLVDATDMGGFCGKSQVVGPTWKWKAASSVPLPSPPPPVVVVAQPVRSTLPVVPIPVAPPVPQPSLFPAPPLSNPQPPKPILPIPSSPVPISLPMPVATTTSSSSPSILQKELEHVKRELHRAETLLLEQNRVRQTPEMITVIAPPPPVLSTTDQAARQREPASVGTRTTTNVSEGSELMTIATRLSSNLMSILSTSLPSHHHMEQDQVAGKALLNAALTHRQNALSLSEHIQQVMSNELPQRAQDLDGLRHDFFKMEWTIQEAAQCLVKARRGNSNGGSGGESTTMDLDTRKLEISMRKRLETLETRFKEIRETLAFQQNVLKDIHILRPSSSDVLRSASMVLERIKAKHRDLKLLKTEIAAQVNVLDNQSMYDDHNKFVTPQKQQTLAVTPASRLLGGVLTPANDPSKSNFLAMCTPDHPVETTMVQVPMSTPSKTLRERLAQLSARSAKEEKEERDGYRVKMEDRARFAAGIKAKQMSAGSSKMVLTPLLDVLEKSLTATTTTAPPTTTLHLAPVPKFIEPQPVLAPKSVPPHPVIAAAAPPPPPPTTETSQPSTSMGGSARTGSSSSSTSPSKKTLDVRATLLAYYEAVIPSKMSDVELILAKYGRVNPEALLAKLEDKYKVPIESFRVYVDGGGAVPPAPSSFAVTPQQQQQPPPPPTSSFGGGMTTNIIDHRSHLAAFYQQFNPEKTTADVDQVLAKYAHKENELWRNLAKKYPQSNDFFMSRPMLLGGGTSPAGTAPPLPSGGGGTGFATFAGMSTPPSQPVRHPDGGSLAARMAGFGLGSNVASSPSRPIMAGVGQSPGGGGGFASFASIPPPLSSSTTMAGSGSFAPSFMSPSTGQPTAFSGFAEAQQRGNGASGFGAFSGGGGGHSGGSGFAAMAANAPSTGVGFGGGGGFGQSSVAPTFGGPPTGAFQGDAFTKMRG